MVFSCAARGFAGDENGVTMPADIGHRTPDTGHRTSDIGHRTSDIGHRTSDIRHPTSDTGHCKPQAASR
ncbi:hypothetical protein BOC40_06850 [Burkholderia pseudomallei]|nr:hypothetical protein BOC40_06850 [Burkholderia pseudomallei]ARL08668.1 hypothetical protein BOC45_07295 [Burkholderia pseudomallei]ARL46243.1 hypothetical protein BOC50_25050 [Burkholderia pseudomallei]